MSKKLNSNVRSLNQIIIKMDRTMSSIIRVVFGAALLYACCGCPVPPLLPYYVVDAFYRTPGGADLLKPKTPNYFRQQDIQIISKISVNGATKMVDYHDDYAGTRTVQVYSGKFGDPNDTSGNHINMRLPNADQIPVETYVRLSPTIVDTITYTFGNNGLFPDKLYYNRKLIWDFTLASDNQFFPRVTIIK